MEKLGQFLFMGLIGCWMIAVVKATDTENGYCKKPWDNCVCDERYPRDCEDVKQHVSNCSGVYTIYIGPFHEPKQTYCDMSEGNRAWTILQRRIDGSEKFNRNWVEYERGFGNIYGEHWLGNRAIHLLTSQAYYRLMIELEDFLGDRRFAQYDVFSVDSQHHKYKLHITRYKGNAGDGLKAHNGMMFSTPDRDNDIATAHCAAVNKGGWWMMTCHQSHLNGEYMNGAHSKHNLGINWQHWKGDYYSLKSCVMKVQRISDAKKVP